MQKSENKTDHHRADMKPYRSYKILACVINIVLILSLFTLINIRFYYQYKIVKRVIPEITFWEWYWGFAK